MKLLLTFFTTLLLTSVAQANFTYEGTLVDPSGNPVTGTVVFTLKIKSPNAANCTLYAETQTISMTNTDGYFSLIVGTGTGLGNVYSLDRVFQNRGTLTSLTCDSGSQYIPVAGESRRMEVTINPNSTGNVVLGLLNLSAVPMADSSRSVNGFEVSHLLRAEDGLGNPLPGLAFTAAQIGELSSLINGASNNYVQKNASNGSTAPVLSGTPGSPVAGTFWYDATMNKMRYFNGSTSVDMGSTGGTVTMINAGVGLVGGSITNSGTINVDVGTTPGKILQLDGSGKIPSAVVQTGTSAFMIPELDMSGQLPISTIPSFITSAMWQSSGPNRYINSGNVGIGTSSPAAALDVTGSVDGVVALFSSPSYPNVGIAFKNNTSTTPYPYLGMQAGDLVYRRGGGVESVRISNSGFISLNGRVGVNNQAPVGALDIMSDTSFPASAVNLQRNFTDNTAMKLQFVKARGTSGSPAAVQASDTLMNINVLGYDGTTNVAAASMVAVVDGTPMASNVPGALLFSTASSGVLNERMRISSGGNVGIGTNAPSYALHVNGVVAGTSAYQTVSDRRYKRNIASLESPLEKVLQLRGVGFEWRNEEFPNLKFTPGPDIGFIAQEVEAIYPEAVMTDANGYKTVAYSKLVSPLVESTKALYRKLASVEEENQILKQKNSAMESENQLIKSYLCAKDPSAPFCQ